VREPLRLQIQAILHLGFKSVKVVLANFLQFQNGRLQFQEHLLTATECFLVVVPVELDYLAGYQKCFLEGVVSGVGQVRIENLIDVERGAAFNYRGLVSLKDILNDISGVLSVLRSCHRGNGVIVIHKVVRLAGCTNI